MGRGMLRIAGGNIAYCAFRGMNRGANLLLRGLDTESVHDRVDVAESIQ